MVALTVTAVICTRNRPDDLRRTLQSLAWQVRPCDAVLVVDDSDAERRNETIAVTDALSVGVTVTHKDEPGLTASRNLAIDWVDTDVLLYLDDDVVLRPDYVAELMRAFESDPVLAGAGGSIDDDHDYELPMLRAVLMVPGRKSGRVYRSGWSSQTPRGRSAPVEHLIGCNMAYRMDVLASYRFSDEFKGYALGEDLELSHRLWRDGHRLCIVGAARIWHLTSLPRHDTSWGYREVVIRPVVAGPSFNRLAFLLSATTFLLLNLRRNRNRALGNAMAIADVLRRRRPRDLQTIQKERR